MTFFNSIFQKNCSSGVSPSRKEFNRAFKAASRGITLIGKEYKKEAGRNAFKSPEHFRNWFTSKYGTVDINKF